MIVMVATMKDANIRICIISKLVAKYTVRMNLHFFQAITYQLFLHYLNIKYVTLLKIDFYQFYIVACLYDRLKN